MSIDDPKYRSAVRAVVSTCTRIVVLLSVVVGAASLYFFGSSAPTGSKTTGADEKGPPSIGETWYRENASFWKGLEYAPIGDQEALTEAVSALVQARYAGPDFDESLLIRDVAAFLYAISTPDMDEYLRRIAPYRSLPEELSVDAALRYCWRAVGGPTIGRTIQGRDALETLWEGVGGSPGRPVAISRKGAVQVGYAKQIPRGKRDPFVLLSALIYPDFSMGKKKEYTEHWIGPFDTCFPALTRPTRPLEDVLGDSRRTLVCEFNCAVRTADETCFPLHLYLYFSALERVWQVEWFCNRYPGQTCRPF